MGRYYSGDIEGKFWFGVQDSDDASFFGGEQSEPSYLDYYFDKSHLPAIRAGIARCLAKLGGHRKKLDTFFKGHPSYNDKTLGEALGVPEDEAHGLLEWYARLELGEKILQCVEKQGACQFEAEL